MVVPPPRHALFPHTTPFRPSSEVLCAAVPACSPLGQDVSRRLRQSEATGPLGLPGQQLQLAGERRLIRGLAGEVGQDDRSEEHTSELQSRQYLACRLLLEE